MKLLKLLLVSCMSLGLLGCLPPNDAEKISQYKAEQAQALSSQNITKIAGFTADGFYANDVAVYTLKYDGETYIIAKTTQSVSIIKQ